MRRSGCTSRKVHKQRPCMCAQFEYFLPRFAAVLADPEPYFEQWQDEYKLVGRQLVPL